MALITIPNGSYEIRAAESFQFAQFDGFLAVDDTKPSVVTERPTEAGYDFQDAVHNKARRVNITIIISDTSQSIIDPRSFTTFAANTGLTDAQTYVKQQLDIIQDFQDNRYKVTFRTKYQDYEDYLITNINYGETNDQGLTINFSLVEVREGTVETTDNVTAGEYS